MFGTRTTAVSGVQQHHLEALYLRRIREINVKLSRFIATFNDWENADPRLRSRYTREQYKAQFIDYQLAERHSYIMKLRNVRRGFVVE